MNAANWHFFANLYNGMMLPLLQQLQAMIGTVVTTMQPVALAMVALWLTVIGIEVANAHKTIQQVLRDFFIAAMILGLLATPGIYTQWVTTTVLTSIPATLAQAIGAPGTPVAALDIVMNAGIKTAAQVYNALPDYSLKIIPLGMAVIAYALLTVFAVGYTFLVYALAGITIVAGVLIGPVFVTLAAIPTTRRYAAGWLAVLVSGLVAQFLSMALILLLTGAETTTLTQLAANIAPDADTVALLYGLGQAGLLMLLCYKLIQQAPHIAQVIAGGVYHNASGAFAPISNALSGAVGASVGAARGAAGALGAHAASQIGPGGARTGAAAARAEIASRRFGASAPTGQSLSGPLANLEQQHFPTGDAR
jgi:type IV secretory pathway VirB6-like protein